MKKQMIRVLTLALCVVMVLGLAACGSNGQGTAPAQEPQSAQSTQNTQNAQSDGTAAASEYAWKSSFVTIPTDEDTPMFQPLLFTDNGFLATGQVTLGRREPAEGEIEEYEGQFNIYGSMLYFISGDGKIEPLFKVRPGPAKVQHRKLQGFLRLP